MILQVLFESNKNCGHSTYIFLSLTRLASIFKWHGETMENEFACKIEVRMIMVILISLFYFERQRKLLLRTETEVTSKVVLCGQSTRYR